jgi:transcriptional regulator with XRE-family HTH domain
MKDNALPEKIMQRMRELNINTASELAIKANLDKASISRYINGRRLPRYGELRRLADALRTTVDYLMQVESKPVQETKQSFKSPPSSQIPRTVIQDLNDALNDWNNSEIKVLIKLVKDNKNELLRLSPKELINQ